MGSIDGLDLGTFGLFTFDFEDQPAAQMRESIQELEEQGWRAFWIPELLGREALTHAGYLLSCTEHIKVINGIAEIWSREPTPTPTGMCSVWDSAATRSRGPRRSRP
jgi:alkanesulfonate monooxygenase SsuD/methylene tetrahydromethanopterin reductase-like flavin-dependent oxidoreductase (luciferase family)